ncbi:MAG TPA: hypothetical protein EYO32_09525 [Rhodospirillales bacterium]|nr:hypothetical protein [Rhodospirillales bacterium]HIN76887.1 hypothetical protein [Rhodospirillales bacterium]HIO39560.1 hypothetical protein [Rhodospirillales bacterium]
MIGILIIIAVDAMRPRVDAHAPMVCWRGRTDLGLQIQDMNLMTQWFGPRAFLSQGIRPDATTRMEG